MTAARTAVHLSHSCGEGEGEGGGELGMEAEKSRMEVRPKVGFA